MNGSGKVTDMVSSVIPAKAGIQRLERPEALDPGFRRDDEVARWKSWFSTARLYTGQ